MSARVLRLAVIAGIALAIAVAFGVRGVATSHARSAARAALLPSGEDALELRVPHAQGAITLDGDTDDPGWQRNPARTGAFLGPDGVNAARPHSEAKLVWGDGHLYVELYAADEDIRAEHEIPDGPVWESDSFHLVFRDGVTERSFDISPLGTLTDGERRASAGGPSDASPFDYGWKSGAHLSHELDGTPNHPQDDDEEWVIEMAIPFEALGLKGEKGERIGLSMRRCDTLKSGARSCGAWGEREGGAGKRGVLVFD